MKYRTGRRVESLSLTFTVRINELLVLGKLGSGVAVIRAREKA
jgi:hypothetical protein